MDVTMAESGELPVERSVDVAAFYDVLGQTKTSVEEIIDKMLAIKKEAQPKVLLREPFTQILLNFVTLSQANRSILLEEDRVRAERERAKASMECTTLQLSNLMYEKQHYIKAIKACKDFKSKYANIELVSKEEFLRNAPEEVKSSALSPGTAHDFMLKRLNYELSQRKELCKLHDKLVLQKKALEETIANRKRFISSLPSQLKALKKATLPMENQLGVMPAVKLKQEQLAELLPTPLYVIYSQLLSQKEAFRENIELEITGNVKDAQSLAKQLAKKGSGIIANLEDSELEIHVPDGEDGQSIYQSHPLKVSVHIYDEGALDLNSSKLITLTFEFLTKLNVVCVEAEDSEIPQNDILCNLFPDDPGLDLPQQAAKLSLGNSLAFDEKRTSRPYIWAQHLAGIDFLQEVPPLVQLSGDSDTDTNKHGSISSGLSLYRQQNRVQTVVQRIRTQTKARL